VEAIESPGEIGLDEEAIARFHADGFLFVDDWLPASTVEALRARYAPLFRGDFETGLQPDEWNWREGRDDDSLTRQICNGWKADRQIARVVLSAAVGRACARLMGWPGVRLAQDNVIWKPVGARSLGFHQDDSYQDWVVPGTMVTCWIALDDTSAEAGTMELVRGSHRWALSPTIAQFHAPEDYRKEMRAAAARAGLAEPEIVPVEVKAGGLSFHHGRTWHGSGPNRGSRPRRSLVAHCYPAHARFHEETVGAIYGRYKRFGST